MFCSLGAVVDGAVGSVALLVPFVCRGRGSGISLLLARFRLEVGVRESWMESGCDCGVADAGAGAGALRMPLIEAMASVGGAVVLWLLSVRRI